MTQLERLAQDIELYRKKREQLAGTSAYKYFDDKYAETILKFNELKQKISDDKEETKIYWRNAEPDTGSGGEDGEATRRSGYIRLGGEQDGGLRSSGRGESFEHNLD